MPEAPDRRTLPPYRTGAPIDLDEIRDLLMDEGYGADTRKDWLKSVLTGIAQDEGRAEEERSRLAAELQAMVDTDRDRD